MSTKPHIQEALRRFHPASTSLRRVVSWARTESLKQQRPAYWQTQRLLIDPTLGISWCKTSHYGSEHSSAAALKCFCAAQPHTGQIRLLCYYFVLSSPLCDQKCCSEQIHSVAHYETVKNYCGKTTHACHSGIVGQVQG